MTAPLNRSNGFYELFQYKNNKYFTFYLLQTSLRNYEDLLTDTEKFLHQEFLFQLC